MSGRSGFSLLEVGLAAGLSLVLLTLLAQVIIPGVQVFARETVRMEVGQMAALALEKLVADLRRSAPEGVGFTPTSIGIQRLETISDSGARVWEPRSVIYWWDGQRLLRRWYPPSPPTLSLALSPARGARISAADLAIMAAAPESEGTQPVATGVARFALSAAGNGPGLQPPLRISLEVEGVVARGGRERILLERAVNFVN